MKTLAKLAVLAVSSSLLFGCATGNTPQAKKKNAQKETNAALKQIKEEHSGAQASIDASKAYVVCTGSDSYLFAVASGGGVCVLNEKPGTSYYRFASVGAGVGIGFKKVAFVYAFMDNDALKRFKESGVDGGARAEASAKYKEDGDQAAANASLDVDGVRIYQINLAGAAAQATVQGYKFWETDFTDDVMQNNE